MFNRNFWRLVSLVSAAGASFFLVRSMQHKPIALPDKTREAVKSSARNVRKAAAKVKGDAGNGDARRAH